MVGDTWHGQQVAVNATGTVQDDGFVGVTLSPYQPQRFRNMTMTMALLLSDSNFQTSWIAVDNKVDNASGMFDSQCSESAFLGARFQVCGNDWGWGAEISQVYLEPWRPGERGIFFQIHDKDDKQRSYQTKVHEVKVQFEDGNSPALWAIPEDPKESEKCEFPTVSAEGLPNSEDFRTAAGQAARALGTSPPAMCEFISRGCPNVTIVRPRQSTVRKIEDVLCGHQSIAESPLADHCSSKIAPILHCFRQADRNVDWAWGQGSSWQAPDYNNYDQEYWGRLSADTFWIEGICPGIFTVLPLKVEDLVKILSPNASKVDEGLVQDACSFILSNRSQEMRATIMATLAGAALKTNNPLAVRLVGKECFNSSQMLNFRRDKVVSLAWDSAKANSKGLQILNETLWWEDADFVKSMLQFAASDQCGGCADVLQELLHVTGRSWPSLVFKSFYLRLGRNSVAFLQINATVPWICVDELVVEHHQKQIGPPFAFGLQNFLQQLNMCTPPISAVDIQTPLTPEGLGQLIGLETKLPKTLGLKLDFDGVPMFLQKLPLLPQLENLETLKLSLENMDDALTSTFCETMMKQPSTKLKEIKFRGGFGRQNHTEGMIAISKMVAALPGLERLDVSENHIGDAGFEAFSDAMAPVASNSKLRSIDVGRQHGNLGNVGVQALGKTLALLPALEEVDISWNENITDEGVVGFLSPFLNKSLCSLRKIYIGGTNVSDAGVAVLAELMEKQPLEEISIAYTMITDEGLRLLGHALQNATCLLKNVYAFQRRENKACSDEGVLDLLQSLEHCPNLVHVDVEGPKLSNETIRNASEALSGWQNLTTLDVTYGERRYNLKETNPLL